VCLGGKHIHAENTEPDVSFPQYMAMIFTSSFDNQDVHCLLIIIIYAQHRPCANPSTADPLPSHHIACHTCCCHCFCCLLHCLSLFAFSFPSFTLSHLQNCLPPLSTYSHFDGHVAFSFIESVLAKKHSCVFYPFLHIQRLLSVTFRHLSFCLL